jgi:hypothetical protein
MDHMRQSDKETWVKQTAQGMLGVDFHHFIEKEPITSNVELSKEFGVSIGEVRKLRRLLEKR